MSIQSTVGQGARCIASRRAITRTITLVLRFARRLALAACMMTLAGASGLADAQTQTTSLQAPVVYPVDPGMDVLGAVAADFNGDGVADFAIVEVDPASSSQFELVVYQGSNDGSFSVASRQTISGTLAGVAGGTNHVLSVGHFNGPTQPPGLAIAMTTSPLCGTGGPGLYLLTPSPGGNLLSGSVGVCMPTKDAPTSVAVGDFNSDGYDDIAVSYPSGSIIGTVSIYLNIGSGSVQPFYWDADYSVSVSNTVATLYGTLVAGNVGALSPPGVAGATTPATSLALLANTGTFTQYVDVLVPFMLFNTTNQTTTLTFEWAASAVAPPSILSDVEFAPPASSGGGTLIGVSPQGAYSIAISPTLAVAGSPVMGATTNLASPAAVNGYALAIADFDGNGTPDLAFLSTNHALGIALNPSAISVTAIGPFGPQGQALAVGSSTLTSGGAFMIVDAGVTLQTTPLFTTATVARSIAVFHVPAGSGQPSIAPQINQSAGLVNSTVQPAFAVADLDGSGIPGVAALGLDAASFAATITPFKNIIATGGTGYFTAQPVIDLGGGGTLTGPAPNGYAVVSGKFRNATVNPGGLRDLALYSSQGPTVLTNMGGFVFALDTGCAGAVGFSSNCYVASESHFPGLPNPYGAVPPMLAVDVNGDGVDDIVMAFPENCSPFDGLTNPASAVRAAIYVFISNGDGTFQAPVYYPSPVANPVALAAGNILGSGHPDIVVANGGEACSTTLATAPNPLLAIALLPNSASAPGTFGTAQAVITQPSAVPFPNVSSVAVADMNLDGVPDIVASENDGLHVILSPSPSIAAFTDEGAVPLYGSADSTLQNASQITIADFNRDGAPDVAAVIGGIAYIFPNFGPGNLQSPLTGFAAGPNSTQAVGIDVDADGSPDLLVADSPGFSVLINLSALGTQVGTPAHLKISAAVSPPASSAAGATSSIAITVKNDGPAAASSVTVTYLVPSGLAFVPSTAAGGSSSACTEAASTVTCSIGTIAAGATSSTYQVVVAPTLASAASYPSTFTAASAAPEGVPLADATVTVNVPVNAAPSPTLTSVNPASGMQSQQNLLLTLTGTGFEAADAQVFFSNSGVTQAAGSMSVQSSTTATADINIAATAPLGASDVTFSTAAGSSTLTGAFIVQAVSAPSPIVLTINDPVTLSETSVSAAGPPPFVLTINDPVTLTDGPASTGGALAISLTINETTTLMDGAALVPGPAILDPESVHVGDLPFLTLMPSFVAPGPVAYYSAQGLGFAGNSGSQVVTLSNIGGGPLNIASMSVLPPSNPSFAIAQIACSSGANSFPTALPSGGACNVTIAYTASPSGSGSGSIVFTDNSALSNLPTTASGSSWAQTLTLSGTGATTTGGPPPATLIALPTIQEAIHVTDTPKVVDSVDVEGVHITDKVNVALINTLAGANVTVDPLTPASVPLAGVTVTFGDVTAPGTTSVISGAAAPAPNAALLSCTPPISLDISTTATYSGGATICISPSQFRALCPVGSSLWHYNGTAWQPLPAPATVPPGAPPGSICGVTTSFSPFALFAPAPTSIVLKSSANPARVKQKLTYTATVTASAGAAPSSGTVSFYQGKRLLAKVALNSSGQASYTTSYTEDDPVSISATFSGTADYLGSTSATLVEVIKG